MYVVPPTNRLDLQIPEDLVEEVVRMFGFYEIPSDETPVVQVVKKITPAIVIIDEKIKDILTSRGYDETLTWPLTKINANEQTNYREWEIVSTQNSMNEEYPNLRQTLAPGLLAQMEEYRKLNLEYIQLFEIGKVFGRVVCDTDCYEENESLGMLLVTKENTLTQFKNDLETVMREIGILDISYQHANSIPALANPYTVLGYCCRRKAYRYYIQKKT